MGLILAIEFYSDKDAKVFSKLCLKEGLLIILTERFNIRILPPLNVKISEINKSINYYNIQNVFKGIFGVDNLNATGKELLGKKLGKGVFTLKANKKTGKLISIMEVIQEDDLMIITDTGIMIRQSIENLNIIGRNTQGVKLLKLDDKASIASVTKVIKEDEDENEAEDENTENPTLKPWN